MKFKTITGNGKIYPCDFSCSGDVEFKMQLRHDSKDSHGVITLLGSYREISNICGSVDKCYLEIFNNTRYLIRLNKKFGYIIPFTVLEMIEIQSTNLP